jgi:hypothetical protein
MERSDILFVVLLDLRIDMLMLAADGDALEGSGGVDSLRGKYSLGWVMRRNAVLRSGAGKGRNSLNIRKGGGSSRMDDSLPLWRCDAMRCDAM